MAMAMSPVSGYPAPSLWGAGAYAQAQPQAFQPQIFQSPAAYSSAVSQPTAYQPASLPMLVSQLGQQVRMRPDGLIQLNEPLIEQLAVMKDAVVPVLRQYLAGWVQNPQQYQYPIIEALYLGHRLVEEGATTAGQLYPLVSPLNFIQNPLIQTYLAGFYRKLPYPHTFGPMLATLINRAVYQYGALPNVLDPAEEVGGSILQAIANRTADATVKRLKPYLEAKSPAPQEPVSQEHAAKFPAAQELAAKAPSR